MPRVSPKLVLLVKMLVVDIALFWPLPMYKIPLWILLRQNCFPYVIPILTRNFCPWLMLQVYEGMAQVASTATSQVCYLPLTHEAKLSSTLNTLTRHQTKCGPKFCSLTWLHGLATDGVKFFPRAICVLCTKAESSVHSSCTLKVRTRLDYGYVGPRQKVDPPELYIVWFYLRLLPALRKFRTGMLNGFSYFWWNAPKRASRTW